MSRDSTRRKFLRATAIGGGLAVTGCLDGGGGGGGRAAIGLPTPQSGPLATPGKAGMRGARIAAQQINQDRETDIELVFEDGQAKPPEARSVVQGMIDDGIPVITGTFSSDVSNALSDLAEEEQVPFMTAISVAPQITDPEDDYTFRLTGDTNQKLKGVSQFLADRGVSGVAVLGADYSMGQSAVTFMQENAGDYGFSVEHTGLVPIPTDNFVPELRKIDTDAVDALFIPFPGPNGPTLVEQIRGQGIFDAVDFVVGHDSYGTELYKAALGGDIAGVYNWGVDLSNDRATAASESMAQEYDDPPRRMDALSLPNYDAVHMIARAMDNVSSPTPGNLRDELADMTYDAASGWTVEFGDSGDNVQYRMLVSQWVESGGELRNEVQYTSDVIAP